jgi:hypothetical protein
MDDLVQELGSFEADTRRQALEALARRSRSGPPPDVRPEVNLHCHTFFSYNAYGYSPSRFAWEAWRYGLEVAGIIDFDVLDGTREFLEAGQLLGLKTVSGCETRVFIPEFEGIVTNSPHEPGVSYFMVTGFVEPPPAGTDGAAVLASMTDCARARNLRMMASVNEFLSPVVVDYERDVLPLTPAGNATERHMLVAYDRKARELLGEGEELVEFWSEKLAEPEDSTRELLADPSAFKNLVRSRLMKYGGVGYAAPQEGSFPELGDVVEMALTSGAIPSAGWLDGTSPGEADPEYLLTLMKRKGIPALTVIPDRNWNLSDVREKAVKVANLNRVFALARELEMPVFVGTEMNKRGQKFVDTFSAPELAPHRQICLEGARVAWAHTLLMMTMGVGYTGPWADRHFGDDAARRNDFFRQVGAAPYPPQSVMDRLRSMDADAGPHQTLSALEC